MKQQEITEIIQLLKNGKYYIYEDREDSVIYRWIYVKEENIYHFMMQDTIAGGLMKELKVSEREFIKLLIEYYSEDDFLGHIF